MKTFSTGKSLRAVYLFILVITLFMGLIPGGFISYSLSYIPFFAENRAGLFISVFAEHIVMLLTLELFLRKLFGRSVVTFVCGEDKNAGRFILIVLLTIVIYTIPELITGKENVINSVDSAGMKILFLLLSALFFLPQTLLEEALFRALPERIFSPQGEKRRPWEKFLLALVCGILFILPHLWNVEVTSFHPLIPIITYFLWGFLSSLLGQREHSYLSVWAMHYANNIFSVTAVGMEGTTVSGAPLFYTEKTSFSPLLPATISLLFLVVYLFDKAAEKRKRVNEAEPY